MSKILVCLLVVLLTACGTGVNGERYIGRPGSTAWFDTADPETIRAHFEEICSIYGYKPDTIEMNMCVERTIVGKKEARRQAALKSSMERKERSRERRDEIRQRSNESVQRILDKYIN